jgi:hypothetical protein
MTRRLTLLALLVALAAPALGTAANRQPKHAYTAAGQALARKIVLTKADLPAGFTGKPSSSSTSTTPSCPGFKPDQSDLTEIGEAESPEFSGPAGVPYVSSQVSVFLNPAQAKKSFERVVRPGLTQCLSSFLTGSAPKGMTFSVTSQRLDPIKGLGDQAAAATLALTARQGTQVLRFVVQFHAVRKGAVAGLVLAVNLGGPYPGAAALTQKLVSRMP